jgi:hypothetical protein
MILAVIILGFVFLFLGFFLLVKSIYLKIRSYYWWYVFYTCPEKRKFNKELKTLIKNL